MNERIEESLRAGLARDVPEQMRERILGRLAEEPSRARPRFWSARKLALAAMLIAALAVTIFCGISDARRCSRLQAMIATPADTRIAAAITQSGQ